MYRLKGEYPYFAKRIWQEHNIEIKMEEGDNEILKAGTVDFFSFSYYMSNCISTDNSLLKTKGNLFGGVKILI